MDAALAASERRAEDAEAALAAALEQAAAARTKSERLVEMLAEAEAWGADDGSSARAVGGEAGGAKAEGAEGERGRRGEGRPEADARATGGGDDSVGNNGSATAGAAEAKASSSPEASSSVREAASAKLAAEILAGSDLGRAYHPLLASIEARLLNLRSESVASEGEPVDAF